MLLRGEEPKFGFLLLLPPPPLFQVWDPDPAGRPRRWNKPWQLIQSHTGKDSQSGFPGEDPILRMTSSAEHPTDSTTQVFKNNQSTLLGYFWNLQEDSVSTNKNSVINLMPARRGIRPSSEDISGAEDLLRLHRLKPLTHRHALSCAHLLFEPKGGQLHSWWRP